MPVELLSHSLITELGSVGRLLKGCMLDWTPGGFIDAAVSWTNVNRPSSAENTLPVFRLYF